MSHNSILSSRTGPDSLKLSDLPKAGTGDGVSAAIDRALLTLQHWVEERHYAGHEPYDILNAPLLGGRWARSWPLAIVFIQLGKRFAGLRLRRWLGVPQSKNPKALALFLAAYCDLARCGEDTASLTGYLKSELKQLRSPNEAECCWGYDWDFVSRGGRMPAFSPNSIATCFCAHALLDMAETFGDDEAREMAQSVGRFLVTRLNRPVDTRRHLCFSYTPRDQMKVYNASVHVGALLARLASHEPEYLELARRAMSYLVSCQDANGAWYYGAARKHRWIDGFHSAYNVEALHTYQRSTGDAAFYEAMRRGYEYYVATFFRADGAPKYLHDSLYPIDIHSCSQAILTFCDLAELDRHAKTRALHVTRWTLKNMRGADGTFFFQKHRFWTNRTPYMRWGQAWMFHALARLTRQYFRDGRKKARHASLKPASTLAAHTANAQAPLAN